MTVNLPLSVLGNIRTKTRTHMRRGNFYQLHPVRPRAIHKPPPSVPGNIRPKMRTHIRRGSHHQVHSIKPRAIHRPPPLILGNIRTKMHTHMGRGSHDQLQINKLRAVLKPGTRWRRENQGRQSPRTEVDFLLQTIIASHEFWGRPTPDIAIACSVEKITARKGWVLQLLCVTCLKKCGLTVVKQSFRSGWKKVSAKIADEVMSPNEPEMRSVAQIQTLPPQQIEDLQAQNDEYARNIADLRRDLSIEVEKNGKNKESANKMAYAIENKDLYLGHQDSDDAVYTRFKILIGQIKTWSVPFAQDRPPSPFKFTPEMSDDLRNVAPAAKDFT